MEKFRQKRSKIASIADRSSGDRFFSTERAHREGQIVFFFFFFFLNKNKTSFQLFYFSLCLVTEKSKEKERKNEDFKNLFHV
jgi:hypothetical protein